MSASALLRRAALCALLLSSPLIPTTTAAAQEPTVKAAKDKKPYKAKAVQPAPGPLSADAAAALAAIPEDEATKKLLGVNEKYEGRSYMTGDEWNMHLFFEHIDGIGGAYMGVGSDQAYLLISWARPEIALLTDYDPNVVNVHRIYRSFFTAADSPAAFMALWGGDKEAEALALLEKDWGSDAEHGPIVKKVYEAERGKVLYRLRALRSKLKEVDVPSYLTSKEHYTYVRDLILAGRLRAMTGNLLDKNALTSIGAFCKAQNIPMHVVYLSNAEEYWPYPDQFRQNMRAQHFDDKSVILRTLSTFSTNKDYRYAVQPALHFVEWLFASGTRKVYNIVPRRKLEGPQDIDFILVDKLPAKSRRGKYTAQ
jgi:hypothetical protein